MNNKNNTTRRAFLQRFGAGAGCFAVAAGVSFIPTIRHASAQDATQDSLAGRRARFPHGVASADPAPDGIVLWTRAEPLDRSALPLPIIVQVSADKNFATVVVEQPLSATLANDYTLRVTVTGLEPDSWYYYRFISGTGDTSRTGRTHTAPDAQSTAALRMAMASCQNYEQGFFGAWARLVADDEAAAPAEQIHAVMHLGDFIYETSPDLPEGVEPVRRITPFPDGGTLPDGRTYAVTVADYRHLYKTYLEDEALQAARARWPFICTWDDHEFTNDSWQSYSTYPGAEGPAQQRKVAANQAWFEFIPARLTGTAHDFAPVNVIDSDGGAPLDGYLIDNADNKAALASLTIYRSLEWGRTASIIVTDTRSYRAPQPMDAALESAIGAPAPPTGIIRSLDEGMMANDANPPAVFEGANGEQVPNPRSESPSASLLGHTQKAWFKTMLEQSTATWKLWANSIPATPLRLDLSSLPFQGLPNVAIGIDAWNGYPGELRELMSFVHEQNISGVVSCAGDYHMHAAAILTTDPDAEDPQPAAVEFATTGISSLTMFGGAERVTRGPDDPFRPLVVAEGPDGEILENFNLLMMRGTRAALAANLTGSTTIGGWLGNDNANPYLKYMDSHSNGFTVLAITGEGITGTITTVENANEAQTQSTPAPVLRRATLTVPAWQAGENPQMQGPVFEGRPPFPFA